MQPDRPRLQVLIGNRDVTDRCDSVTFSATDTGGYEIATLGLPSVDRPAKGTAITIRSGLDVAWAGRVAEVADHSQHGRATKTTGCEGWRALLRDTLYSMVYVDRDLTRWVAPSNSRQIVMVNATQPLATTRVAPDITNGLPALTQEIDEPIGSGISPTAEAWYDAGPGNLIASVYYNVIASGVVLATIDAIFYGTDDTAELQTAGYWSTNLFTTTGVSGYFTGTTPKRYAVLSKQFSGIGPNNPAGTPYVTSWRTPAVYGNHGLPLRGPDPGGFWPSDIASHALSQCGGVVAGAITPSIGLIVPQLVYRTATAADVIVDDMARLMGWTWGVWEPSTILGTSPRMDFRPPPADATCVVSKAECDQLDITSRLGDLYNVAQVTYTDAAGKLGVAVVSQINAQLSETGITTRTLVLNMGIGSPASAAAFGAFALALSQVAARAAGQATLPASVRLPNGGSKPAHLLKPGIDRLRIIDLVDGGPMLDIGTVRRDVFRISRTETTVAKDGTASTRVELDSGSNLLETLQARLAIAAGVVGSGASGG